MALLTFLELQLWWQENPDGTLFYPWLFSLLLLVSLLLVLKHIRAQKPNLPPSPSKLPIIGNLHQLGMFPHRSFRALSAKYGPLMLLHLGQSPTLIVSSAEMAKEIMKTHDVVFANRPMTTATKILLYGCRDVGFSPYGDFWRQVRKICVLELLNVKRVQAFQFVREEEVVSMVEKICSSCSKGEQINLSEMLRSLCNNTFCRSALGRKYEDGDGKNRFGTLTKDLMLQIGEFSFGDFFPLLKWMDVLTGLVGRLNKTFRALDGFFDQVIEEHRTGKTDGDEQPDEKDFVDILLRIQKESTLGANLTHDNLKAIVMNMFVGGSDPTSTALEWTMAELVKNPRVMKKAQEEVRRVVGIKSKVDENDLKQMEYLHSVIKEGLRLHPPSPLLLPHKNSESVLIQQYHIPSETKVLINAWAIQRDPKTWDKPEEFIPERFYDNPIDFRGQDFELIPFGAGRRGCPGSSFSIVLLEYVISNLLYWFDWELPDGAIMEDLDMAELWGLSVYKKIPLHLVPVSRFPS